MKREASTLGGTWPGGKSSQRSQILTDSLLPGPVANVQVRLAEAAVRVEGLPQVKGLSVLEGEHQVDLW